MNQMSLIEPAPGTTQVTREDLVDAVRSMGLLADLTISLWSGERTDAQVAARVKRDANAVGNVGRYTKNLLAGCDTSLKELRSAYSSARTLHYQLTLPWVANNQDRMNGPRLLPNMLFERYLTEITKIKTEAEARRDAFIAEYPSLVQRAMANLAGLALAADYPDPEVVRAAFKLHFDFSPIPPASAFPNLPDDMLTALGRNLVKRQEASIMVAQSVMWERVREHVSHLATRLADPEASFRETTIENVRELVSLLPGFNCAQDARVGEVIEDISRMLDGVSAKEVRADNSMRARLASDANALAGKLTQWGL